MKQARTLSKQEIDEVLSYLATTRHAKRNRLIFLLSAKAGLRAKEIAGLTWWMTNDSQGQVARTIHLQDTASKGKSGRLVPLNEEVRERPDRVPERGDRLLRTPRNQYRTVTGDLGTGHREYVPALVPAPRLRRLLQSQRPEDLHHQRG